MNSIKGIPFAKPVAELPKQEQKDPKMMEAAQSFENQLLRQMIAEMRKTVPKDELIGENMGERIFRDELDSKYADLWTEQGGTGLADLIYQQLMEKNK